MPLHQWPHSLTHIPDHSRFLCHSHSTLTHSPYPIPIEPFYSHFKIFENNFCQRLCDLNPRPVGSQPDAYATQPSPPFDERKGKTFDFKEEFEKHTHATSRGRLLLHNWQVAFGNASAALTTQIEFELGSGQ